ncbi:MAG: hypothetical protein AB8G99_13725 [Planctomycetaceae bacterium]
MLAIATMLLVVPFDSDLPTIRGIDLNRVPVTHQSKVPEFFEPSPDSRGRKKWRKTVFKMPLLPRQDDSAFLYFPAGTERFYINYRSNRRDPKTEKLFGPIEGHPFKVLKLEADMIKRIKDGNAYDVPNRLSLMLRTGDPSLARRAFLVLFRMTELDVEGHTLENNHNEVTRIVTKYRDHLNKHTKPEQFARFESKLARVAQRIESLIAEIPDSEYQRAKDVKPPLPKTIADAVWGEVVDGLRMAAVPVELATTEVEQVVYIYLVIENAGQKPIRLATHDVVQNVQTHVRLPNKKPAPVNGVFYSGVSPIVRFHLGPGERVVIGKVGLTAAEDRTRLKTQYGVSPVVHKFDGDELKLTANYTLLVGYGSAWSRGGDGIMRRTLPAKGEYKGKLVTADVEVMFRKKADEKTK